MVWQMERTRAPAQLAKIAMGGISMQCALDGAVFVGVRVSSRYSPGSTVGTLTSCPPLLDSM